MTDDRKHYCVGFLFDDPGHEVVLMRRAPKSDKPEQDWQVGRLNGLGGSIEPGESPTDAMRREFKEEAGLDIGWWEEFAVLDGKRWKVHCFRARSIFASAVQSPEGLALHVLDVNSALREWNVVPNLHFLLPLALNPEITKVTEFCYR